VEGARYDPAVDPACYVALVVEKMDAALGADDDSRVVILVDCRGGDGWPNPTARRLLPLLKHTAAIIPNVYPERLRNVLVYPLAPWIGRIARGFVAMLDVATRDRVVLVDGKDGDAAPAPQALSAHVTRGPTASGTLLIFQDPLPRTLRGYRRFYS